MSSAGSLIVTDLDIDLASKTVYGTVIGGNGVGRLTHLALWDVSSVVSGNPILSWSDCVIGPPVWDCMGPPPIGIPTFTLSGLQFTMDGRAKFTQSLGLLSLGKAAVDGITDYGTITVTVVPEPSSLALMGMGLLGMVLTVQRRTARATRLNSARP